MIKIVIVSNSIKFDKGVFNIFAESHKIVASNIYDNVLNIYGLKLDKEKLLWGSIAPDFLPQYKLIRHYQDESINYISKEIVKIIFISRYLEFNKILDPLAINLLSKKIGVISHYLSDYVCLPHARRWTFSDSMMKHIKYESALNNYAINHTFKKNVITVDNIGIFDDESTSLKVKIKEFIEKVVEEYSLKTSLKHDLDFALSLNLKITYFILDSIKVYSEDMHKVFALEIL
ncbi:hypothetical protein E9840_00065 [Tissierella creatinini]|nr:hypothetical protein E9840_00065 [Tissierella creatinini]TJX59320.1 hypothetical protein E8P77_21390 [Soehngenia saccharolytica]